MSEKMGRKMPESASSKAKKIANETMSAISNNQYPHSSGNIVQISGMVGLAFSYSKLYKPDWDDNIYPQQNTNPKISVVRESTLEAALRLSKSNACVLNFASAKNPGGGFLRGAIAQEESLARSSALYYTLIKHPEYYEKNNTTNEIYTDYVIYSPKVPVIKNDNGDFLDEPYTMNVMTSPAPNRTAILEQSDNNQISDEKEKEIANAFYKRMIRVLKLMAANNHRTIVLGAWGCGIFGNDPLKVSKMFRDALKECPYFDEIVFAIYDNPNSDTFKVFEMYFNN